MRDMDRCRLGLAFGSALSRLRRARNFTQEELAEEAGLDCSYPAMLEAGMRTPTISTIFKLAAALRITPGQLMDMTEEEHRTNFSDEKRRVSVAGIAAAHLDCCMTESGAPIPACTPKLQAPE
jgi:transcriptional regulator with XRE-family HTH domain